MQAIDTFALSKHNGAYEQWPQHTPLLADGANTGKCVPGYVIEAQYRCGEHYLLINSWDCPFEEAQTFLLLSSSFDVLYEETLGAPYASYLLMSLCSAKAVDFWMSWCASIPAGGWSCRNWIAPPASRCRSLQQVLSRG
jgi:hypothetical protein